MTIGKEIQVGGALLLAVLVLYLGQRFLRDLPVFAGTHTYVTVADNASGLVPGNAVWINGVLVGSVSDVKLGHSSVEVQFTVTDEVALPHGTMAAMGGFAFVGDMRLDLVLGSPDTSYHQPGDVIPEQKAEGGLGSLSAAVPALMEQLDTIFAGAGQTISAAQVLLEHPGSGLNSSLNSIGGAAESLNALLEAESGILSATLTDIRLLAVAVTDLAEDSLATTIGNLNGVTTRLERNLHLLEQATVALSTLLERINAGEGTLGKLATDPELYDETTAAVTALRRILEELEENPRKYLREVRLVDIF